MFFQTDNPDNTVFENDVFISYSSKDCDGVEQSLLPVLDQNNIKYIIHSRDFVPEKAFYENMAESVYNSRKVILVISMNYLASGFCKDEMRMALHRCTERDDASLILLRIDNIKPKDIPRSLRHRTFIDYTSAEEVTTWQNRVLENVQSNDIIVSQSTSLEENLQEKDTKRLLFSSFRLKRKKKQKIAKELENQV